MIRQAWFAAAAVAALGSVAAPSLAAQVGVYINVAPPPMRYEVVPEARRGYDWTPGYWDWNDRRHSHRWVAGSWVRARPGYIYAQPVWVEDGGRWHQQRGSWARGDRDRDGIPNGRDRAPDNPRRY